MSDSTYKPKIGDIVTPTERILNEQGYSLRPGVHMGKIVDYDIETGKVTLYVESSCCFIRGRAITPLSNVKLVQEASRE